MVCVIGSSGKTTTARAVALALGIPERRITERNEATFVALAMLRIRPWQRRAVVEVGIDGPGQMSRYRDLVHPNVVVVTSIASDHARFFRTLEATRAERQPVGTGHLLGGLREGIGFRAFVVRGRQFLFDARNRRP